MTTFEKIKAEIIKEYGDNADDMSWSYRSGLAKAIEIVEKYAEQEPCDDVVSRQAVFEQIRDDIEPKCDRINSLASVLPYAAHREIQELLCEIMDLCKAESEERSKDNG